MQPIYEWARTIETTPARLLSLPEPFRSPSLMRTGVARQLRRAYEQRADHALPNRRCASKRLFGHGLAEKEQGNPVVYNQWTHEMLWSARLPL
jgi:hypothetical protein